jgi:hypothetical protein
VTVGLRRILEADRDPARVVGHDHIRDPVRRTVVHGSEVGMDRIAQADTGDHLRRVLRDREPIHALIPRVVGGEDRATRRPWQRGPGSAGSHAEQRVGTHDRGHGRHQAAGYEKRDPSQATLDHRRAAQIGPRRRSVARWIAGRRPLSVREARARGRMPARSGAVLKPCPPWRVSQHGPMTRGESPWMRPNTVALAETIVDRFFRDGSRAETLPTEAAFSARSYDTTTSPRGVTPNTASATSPM